MPQETAADAPVYKKGLAILERARKSFGNTTNTYYWNCGRQVYAAVILASVVVMGTTDPGIIQELRRRPAKRGDFEFCGLPAFIVDESDTMRLMVAMQVDSASITEEPCQKP